MVNGTNGIVVAPMQLMRIERYPIKIDDNLIAVDNLEEGTLNLYEYVNGILNIQQLFAEENKCKNVISVAQITINDTEEKGEIYIEKITCCYGYENLAYSMIYQVINFGKFYESCKSIMISENERDKWFLYAGGILADFHKKDKKFVYQIR
jgi:hypothetical protein